MTTPDNEIHIGEERARGGSTPHIVRYVLLFSLLLAIGALSAVWITGAYNSPSDTGGYADSRRAVAETE